jgi:hypothetical protein
MLWAKGAEKTKSEKGKREEGGRRRERKRVLEIAK